MKRGAMDGHRSEAIAPPPLIGVDALEDPPIATRDDHGARLEACPANLIGQLESAQGRETVRGQQQTGALITIARAGLEELARQAATCQRERSGQPRNASADDEEPHRTPATAPCVSRRSAE